MLEKVRASMQSGATYLLVAGLTVIFMFFFGMPSRGCSGGANVRQNTYLADVGDNEVYTSDVDLIFNRVYGNQRNTDDSNYEQRRASALRSVVLIHLFADRARQEGLRVGQDEFKEFMKSTVRNMEFRYAYGRDGSWSGPYYKAYVQNRMGSTPTKYERFKREELLARKYLATQAAQVAVNPAELSFQNKVDNTKLNLAFVELTPEELEKHISLDEEAVSSFVENNADRIKKYYEDNQSDYSTPAQYRVRRVYIVKPDDAEGEEKAKSAQKRWAEAQKRVLDNGEAVGDVAADLGEPFQKENKGLMDWSEAGNMDESIASAVKDAEVGDVNKVETDYAYMLVKLEDKRPSSTTPLSEARQDIAKTLLKEDQVDSILDDVTSKLLSAAKSNDSLDAALKSIATSEETSNASIWKNLEAQTTGDFALKGRDMGQFAAQLRQMGLGGGGGGSWSKIPKIGDSQPLAVTAYKELSSDNPVADEVFEVGGSKYIVRLKNRTEPSDEDVDVQAIEQMESKRTDEVVGKWKEIFVDGDWRMTWPRPPVTFGNWIEAQLSKAVETEAVTFNKKSPVASILAAEFSPAGAAKAPKGGAAPKGSKQKQIESIKKKIQQQMKGGGSPMPKQKKGSDEGRDETSGSEQSE
jgi:parvulin-like peptidyl-prolyl isomerase